LPRHTGKLLLILTLTMVLVLPVFAAPPAVEALLSRTYPPDGPGAAVIVVKDGKTILRKGYGMADLELGIPVDPGMVFRIGSVTKQFTAAAIMLCVERGLLSLDDDVTKFLPGYPTQGRHISIEHLLTHTSGVRSYTGLPSFLSNMRKDYSVAEMIELFGPQPMEFQPGEKWAYSNSGYFLLGAILEKVSGMSYEEFMKQSIFQPLGMDHTAYGSEAPIIPKRVHGYEKGPDGWINAAYLSMTQPYAAGSLVSNVDDLATWDAALTAGKLLRKETLVRMWTPYKLAGGDVTGYGYGWAISRFEGHPVIGHGGGINGFSCHVLRLPDDGLFVALLTNANGVEPSPEYIATKVAAESIGIVAGEPVAIHLDPQLLDQYIGTYRIDDRRTRTITREGDRLFSQRTDGPRLEIFPKSETEFFFKDSFARLTFVKDDEGHVARAEMNQASGMKETAVRTQEAPAPAAPRTAALADAALFDAYAGRYELAPGFVITITSENGHLMAQATGQGKFEIYPESETKFFYKVVDAQITFARNPDGSVRQLTLHQNGRDLPAKRIP